jgi:hypothetical protein
MVPVENRRRPRRSPHGRAASSPGEPGGKTSITVNYYHAPGADKVPTPDYELFETVVLTKRRGHRHR